MKPGAVMEVWAIRPDKPRGFLPGAWTGNPTPFLENCPDIRGEN
jgi:hypothetical protein